jgi:archaellum component FlaC
MDPDVSKKVKDLLGMMQGISSEIDIKAELETITSQMRDMENRLEDLARRFDTLEKAYLEKQKIVRAVRNDLKSLFPED